MCFGNSNNTIENNEISNNKIGIYSQNSSSTLKSNIVCGNTAIDLNSSGWLLSSGNNNTCDKPDGWNDSLLTGCTYKCTKPEEPITPPAGQKSTGSGGGGGGAATVPVTPPECFGDSDCKSNEYCLNFDCVPKKSVGKSCNLSIECLSEMCINKICVECNSDSNCGGDKFCKNNLCVNKKLEGEECKKDNECISNKCENDSCIIPGKKEVSDAVNDAIDAINKARSEGRTAGLNDAENKLNDAKNSLNSGDYDSAKKLANEAKKLADGSEKSPEHVVGKGLQISISPEKPKEGDKVVITVKSNGEIVPNANVNVYLSDGTINNLTTNENGTADIFLPESGTIKLTVSKTGYESYEKTVNVIAISSGENLYGILFAIALLLAVALIFLMFKHKKFVKIPNPYVAGNPIKSKDMFFGRSDVFNFIKEQFKNNTGIAIVLHGDRRTGKTSVLYQIDNGELGDQFIPVFINMHRMAESGTEILFKKIAETIQDSIKKKGINYNFDIDKFNWNNDPYGTFDALLNNIFKLMDNKKIILMIDEYENIELKVDEDKLNPDIFKFFADLIENKDRLFFIFSGTHKLNELNAEYWGIMFKSARYKEISFLKDNEATELIKMPVKDYIKYEDHQVEYLKYLTAGHPYYLQYLCQNLIAHLNSKERNYIIEGDINFLLNDLIENPPPHLTYTWENLSGEHQYILSILAHSAKERDYIKLDDIVEKMGDKLGIDEIKHALKGLNHCDMLDMVSEESGCLYRFKMDLMRYWIKNKYPPQTILVNKEHNEKNQD